MKKFLVVSLLVSTGYLVRMVAFEYALWRITSKSVECIESASREIGLNSLVVQLCDASASDDLVSQVLVWTPQFNQILIEDLKLRLQNQ